MSSSVIKFKGEEKWLGAKFISSSDIKMSEKIMSSNGFTEEEKSAITKAVEFQNANKQSAYHGVFFHFPSKRSVTKLDTAFKSDKDIMQFVDELINYGEVLSLLSKKGLMKNEPYQYNDKTLKEIKEVKKMLGSEQLEIIERDIKNAYINKTAWAIFTGDEKHSGFKAKNGELGEISTARLFDSDKGCEKTAKAMGLSNYEVVEVEVTLRRRTDLKTYHASKLDSAFAILEKERLEQFFAEMDHEKIEEKLQEVKAKKVSKL